MRAVFSSRRSTWRPEMPTSSATLTAGQVALWLGVPEETLALWRRTGCGPRHRGKGQALRYRPDDVLRWLNPRERWPEN